jgi:glycosyltransferase involved in cell wall biosynthesis
MQFVNNSRSYYVDGQPLFSLGSGHLATVKYFTLFSPILQYVKCNNIRFVYIRYIHIATPFYINFLRKLKGMGVSIFLEVPTYPYDIEHRNDNWRMKIINRFERFSRNKFRKYVDKIVTVQDYDTIFGLSTVKISNCVDMKSVPLRTPMSHSSINLLGVANMQEWHGYDRLIKGLGLYYKNGGKEDVHLYLVGDNSNVIDGYRFLINRYNLNDRVHLEGVKEGKELNRYFDIADLAIGGLAAHRKGVYEGKALKCVEYAARGVPFIYSDINTDFDNCPFVKKVSQDESSINVEELLNFVNKQKFDPADIRQYVADNITWDIQMKKVLDVILTNI